MIFGSNVKQRPVMSRIDGDKCVYAHAVYARTAPTDVGPPLRSFLTCDPADFMVSEVASDPGHMCSQTVTQQMDPFPG